MHAEAYEGFGWMLKASQVNPDEIGTILDIGGQHVNGSVHAYFPSSTITTLDLENADIIADAVHWIPHEKWDMVIATELLEHVEHWPQIIRTARLALDYNGIFITTCASTDRPRHGATGAPAPAPGEWYANVSPHDLEKVLRLHFRDAEVHYRYPPGDAYAWARV